MNKLEQTKAARRAVFRAVKSVPKQRLEDAMLGILYMLYMDDGEWNIDKEWDAETIENVAEQIPRQLLDVIVRYSGPA